MGCFHQQKLKHIIFRFPWCACPKSSTCLGYASIGHRRVAQSFRKWTATFLHRLILRKSILWSSTDEFPPKALSRKCVPAKAFLRNLQWLKKLSVWDSKALHRSREQVQFHEKERIPTSTELKRKASMGDGEVIGDISTDLGIAWSFGAFLCSSGSSACFGTVHLK